MSASLAPPSNSPVVDRNASAIDVAVIGGGPAGLMAAETALAAGARVELFDAMGSVGRKFLLAGKGGLNLTHSEAFAAFVARYGERREWVGRWLRSFSADDLRAWARGLGVDTVIGSSGRVFPADFKAAPLLRGWLRRLRSQGLVMHMQHRWLGWDAAGALRLRGPQGTERVIAPAATVLALGGASWPILGSDGAWTDLLAERGVAIEGLAPANVGFEIPWSAHFAERFSGQPVKPVALQVRLADGEVLTRQGEFVITDYGVEGSLFYALGADVRAAVARGDAVWLDLLPDRSLAQIASAIAAPRGGRSLSEHLRRRLHLAGARLGLLRECAGGPLPNDAATLAALLKALPLRLQGPRPIAEAISSAGGVRIDAVDDDLMLRDLPGVFCAGEMLDWEAPTGGYLFTACFASGRVAGAAAARWANARA